MIIDIQTELRNFTYITNLYKCIANYNLMGHQIGRKIGDMLEILAMGAIYKIPDLKNNLDTEGKLEGYTSAKHKVGFGFFENIETKDKLFGAIECKCVGVEETKLGKKNTIKLKIDESFSLPLWGQWMNMVISITCTLKSISANTASFEIKNTFNNNTQLLTLSSNDNIKLIVDEDGNFLNTTPHGDMLTEIPGIIRICKTIKIQKIESGSCTVALFNCLTGPQTIEKAKQASLVAMDLRKKIDGQWGKEDIDNANKKMTFIHIICEFSHWENKSINVIKTCIDHNLIVPDQVLIDAFKKFENTFGTGNMLNFISKKMFENNLQVRNAIYTILDKYESHIFYDIEQNSYVSFISDGHMLGIKLI